MKFFSRAIKAQGLSLSRQLSKIKRASHRADLVPRATVALLPLIILANCSKAPTADSAVIEVPKVETVNVPVSVPGTTTVVTVPETVIVDRGIGIQSLPKDIDLAPVAIQGLGKAVAKVMRADGASGSGFFISADGIFVTNEHVIPRASCTDKGCPGIKIILGFTKAGQPQVFSKFRVIAQDNGNRDYDFTVVKVALAPGQTVPFLNIETSEAAYQYSLTTETGRYIALGHPGGATLRYTDTRPIQKRGIDIIFQGLLIGGNSGGPLVDTKTGKVIGLDKETRDSFVRLNAETGASDKKNMATSARDLLMLLKTEIPGELSTISGFESVQTTELETGLYLPSKSIPKPTADAFSGVLRRNLEDIKVRPALAALDLYIGTDQESSVLDLMLRQDEYTPGPIVVDTLVELFHKQLLVGRPLRLSDSARTQVTALLTLQPGDEVSTKMTASILFNYFDEATRAELQQKCVSAFPNISALASGIIYTCASIEGRNGSSLIAQAAQTLKAAPYNSVYDFGSVTGFLMFADVVGTKDAKDIQDVIDLDKFVTEKNDDVEGFLQNDSFAMGLVKGLVGVASFADTYPK